jgi:menaquinone-9 beta-reductase
MSRPVTIAGGGLAGLSLGIALQERGIAATLHEAGTYPRHRVCGEFLSGVSDSVLRNLGITFSLEGAVPLETSCWFDNQGPFRELPVNGRGISRHLLDDRLRKRFHELGGRLVLNSRIQPAEGVIWAAGRTRTPSDWIGLKAHYTDLKLSHDLEMHAGDGCYVGLAKVEGGTVNVCGLFRRRRLAADRDVTALDRYLGECGLVTLADRLEGATMVAESLCGVAGITFGRMETHSFSVGDAAAMIPPFTGNGMSMALESAHLALDPTLGYVSGKLEWEEALAANRHASGKAFRKRMVVSRMLHPFVITGNPSRWIRRSGIGRFLPFGLLYRSLR